MRNKNKWGIGRGAKQEVKQGSREVLRQEQSDIQNHGGPLLQKSIVFLAKILPCSEALLGRIVWVLLWGWKVAPVALYEALLAPSDEDTIDPVTGQTTTQARGGFQNYVNTWWRKTFVVPSALGFYYFLYEKVAEPLVYSVNCCSNSFLAILAAIGIVVAHFASGLAMHFCQERRIKQMGVQEQEEAAISSYHLQTELAHQGSAMNSASSNVSSPTATNIDIYNEETPTKKKRFWPFRGGRKEQPGARNPLASNSPSSAFV